MLGLVLLGALAQSAWMDATVNVYDEGLMLFGADRVLHGDVPYRDFWTLYGPAGFYALAGLFAAFGETALVERLFDIGVKTAIVALSFELLLVFGRRLTAVAGSLLILGLLIYLRNYSAPMFPAMAAILTAALASYRAVTRGGPGAAAAAVVAGIAVGVAVLFRHDLGGYALPCIAAFLLAQAWRCGPAARRSMGFGFGLGCVLVLAPVAAAFAWAVPARILVEDFIRIPLVVYPAVRALPFPNLHVLFDEALARRSPSALGVGVVYLPPLVIVASLAAVWLRRRLTGPCAPSAVRADRAAFFLLLVALDGLFLLKGLVRVSPVHMGPALIVSVIVVAAGAGLAVDRRWRTGLLAGGAVAAAMLIAKPFVLAAERSREAPHSGAAPAVLANRWIVDAATLCRDPRLPRLRCFRLDSSRQAVAEYLVEHGARGKYVYVGVGRHDKLFVNDLAIYFAAEVLAPTRWHDLHPGIQTTAAVQSEMLVEFAAKPPAYVVINTEWDDWSEPNASAVSSGVTLLDDAIRGHYRPVFASGSLSVLAPRLPGL